MQTQISSDHFHVTIMDHLQKVILISIILLSSSHFGKTKNTPPNDEQCLESNTCIVTYVSEGQGIVFSYQWDKKEIPYENGPKEFDKVLVLIDKNNKYKEIKFRNLSYLKGIWKGKKILIFDIDLDLSKRLRTLNTNSPNFFELPSPDSNTLPIIPMNTEIKVTENTLPISNENAYIKTTYLGKTGWIPKKMLSDDRYDIQYFRTPIQELVKPYFFTTVESDFQIGLKIKGDGLEVTDCSISGEKCEVQSHTIKDSSFGKKQESVYFVVSANKVYVCEIQRETILHSITFRNREEGALAELETFMSCEISRNRKSN
ncbi:hypothetical protein AB3N60_05230 [Leptospira sp. WS39.C2]